MIFLTAMGVVACIIAIVTGLALMVIGAATISIAIVGKLMGGV